MRKYNAGEIVEIAFPYEDSPEEKVRPALVLWDDGANLLLLKITSQLKGFEWDIEIPANDFTGLTKISVVQVNKYAKIPKSKLSSIIPRGVINPMQLGIIKQRLKDYLRAQKN